MKKVYVLVLHWQYGSLVRGVFACLAGAWTAAQEIENVDADEEQVNF